jgi:hypothetical protein
MMQTGIAHRSARYENNQWDEPKTLNAWTEMAKFESPKLAYWLIIVLKLLYKE